MTRAATATRNSEQLVTKNNRCRSAAAPAAAIDTIFADAY